MTTDRYHFLVDLGGGNHAGFRDVTIVGLDGTVSEYRDGAAVGVSVRKLPGLNKSADVTLKRGVMRAKDLGEWLKDVRLGTSGSARTITIRLQNEAHTAAVRTWTLRRSRIVKFEAPDFNAKGNEVEIGTLGLSGDDLVVEDAST